MRHRDVAISLLVSSALATTAHAANGHFLHGVGAANSAMGGAGLALAVDGMSALANNPALLTDLSESTYQFGAEMIRSHNAVGGRVGPASGRTEEAGDDAMIPAFSWTRRLEGSPVTLGMGFLGRAGFGADYPHDPTNPILAAQPRGFGRVHSSLQHLELPLAVARRLGDAISVGGSLNVARASLSADPAGFAAPDCDSGGACYVPSTNTDSAYGFGARLGILWQASERVALAAAYSSEQRFEDFEWNSTVANPSLPTYGERRRIELSLSTPQTLAVGASLRLGDRAAVALDAKWIGYSGASGFGDVLGWEDIMVYALGAQLEVRERLTLRAGLNHGDNPIPAAASMRNVASPAILEDHAAVGLGYQVVAGARLDIAYYHAFENEITGPLIGPAGPVPGASVTNEFSTDSVVFTFGFTH